MEMYKKAAGFLVLLSFVFMACFLCVKGLDLAKLRAEPVRRLKLELWELEEEAREKQWLPEEPEGQIVEAMSSGVLPAGREESGLGIAQEAVSGQRVIDFLVLEQSYEYLLPDEDLEALLRIVEAEAGIEDEEGKLLVANVVLNRVADGQFPDTVSEVVLQRENGTAQFSPVADGSYYQVKISDETIHAVGRALMGEDISQGALYFAARKYADSGRMQWFDENLQFLFQHGGHEFFK